MKKNLFYLFALVCAMSLFTACSDDDDKVVCPVEQTEFTADNGLNLTYNGVPLPGKKVTFMPSATDPTQAILILSGNLSLNFALNREDMVLPAGAGVLPGSPVVKLPVTLDIQGDACTFAGNGETDYCTFAYAGRATASSLDLDLKEVTLKNAALSGTKWALVPADPYSEVQPTHIVWTAEKMAEVEFMGMVLPLPIDAILGIALHSMGLIEIEEGKVITPDEMLCNVLRDITLGADGNISASYIDVANGGTSVVQSPAHVAQYVVLDDHQLKVYLNLDAILANAQRLAASTKAVDMSELISKATAALLPLLTDGVPLNYRKTDGNMTVYLNKDLLLPLLKNIVAPLFEDEEFVAQLVELMKADPSFGSMAGMAEGVLKALPEIINTTSELEIGLNLTAAE